MYAPPKRKQPNDSPLRSYLAGASGPASAAKASAGGVPSLDLFSTAASSSPQARASGLLGNKGASVDESDFLSTPAFRDPLAGGHAGSSTAAANQAKGAAQADTGGAGPGLGPLDFSYESDPVLQKMLMGGAADAADADAAALGQRRSFLQQYGDRGLASSVLGADDPTLDSISDDPEHSTSILARLKRAYGDTVKQNEDSLNENNLFYSGYRSKRLGDLAKDYETEMGDASSQANSALDQIGAQLSATKKGLRDQQAGAESDAANRRLQEILAGILAGGAGGTGETTPPPDGSTDGAPAPDVGADPNDPNVYWDPVKQAWVPRPANSPYELAQ